MKNYLMKVLIFVSFIMICLVVGVYVHAKDNNDMSVAFYKAKQAFNEKVSKKDYVDVKALKNVNGKKQYVLVEGEDAYLIYDTQEYWSGLPFPSPGDLPNPGIEPRSPVCRRIFYCLSHQGRDLRLNIKKN